MSRPVGHPQYPHRFIRRSWPYEGWIGWVRTSWWAQEMHQVLDYDAVQHAQIRAYRAGR